MAFQSELEKFQIIDSFKKKSYIPHDEPDDPKHVIPCVPGI
jgi:hypothetical protein